jgi:hypothetical protein
MPVLEAMACGLPVIVTEGGPTDEFCPPEGGWRIRATRLAFPEEKVDTFETAGHPWMLEPDQDHLVELLRAVAADPAERHRRGEVAHAAAQAFSWDAVAETYGERLVSLAARAPKLPSEPFPLTEDVALRVLACPAWRTRDRLGALLAEWCASTTATTSACLYLLADPATDGDPAALEKRVLEAAAQAGADLEDCADINVLMEPVRPGRDERLHAAVDAYVPLSGGRAGHLRLAVSAGNAIIRLDEGALARLLGERALDGAVALEPVKRVA